MTRRQGCTLISVGCRACARRLATVIVTVELSDRAALCASTQTACNATRVTDSRCKCLKTHTCVQQQHTSDKL